LLGYDAGIPKGLFAFALAVLVAALAACSSSDPIRVPLTDQGNIQLPRETVAKLPLFDLLTMDSRRGYLYVAHTSNSTVDIVDVRTKMVAGSIPGVAGVKQIAITPDPNIIFASASAAGAVLEIDVDARKVLATIPVDGSPDAIDYDPVHDYVVVCLGGAKKVAAIDRKTLKVAGTIDLPGAPELVAIDPQAGRAFVAINDQDSVAAIDLGALRVTSIYKGCDIKAPTGVAYDPAQARLFVADRGLVSVIDVLVDHCLGSVDIGNGVDQITINPQNHHLYTANGGSRNLSVIDIVSLQPLGEQGTGPSGDGVAADPTTSMVYVIVGRAGIIAAYHDP
jgi:DNA-binding beta-propeller fold protein YncE